VAEWFAGNRNATENVMGICTICEDNIARMSPIFYFPLLGLGQNLSIYSGIVHVHCVRDLSRGRDIRAELTKEYLRIFNDNSETPIAARDGNLLVKNCVERRGCFEVLDFEDFVVFHIPVDSLPELKSLPIGSSIPLGVQNLQKLSRRSDGTVELEIKRPHFTVDLPRVSFTRLVHCLDAAEKHVQ
jgi:hypothetical protein